MKERVLDFEAQRLKDVKEVLTEYCRIELTYAAKSLEQWSQCMQKVTQMSPDDDIKVLTSCSLAFTGFLGVREIAQSPYDDPRRHWNAIHCKCPRQYEPSTTHFGNFNVQLHLISPDESL